MKYQKTAQLQAYGAQFLHLSCRGKRFASFCPSSVLPLERGLI